MYRVGIDVGGTFTDFVLTHAQAGTLLYFKVPSTPDDPSVGIAEGLREMLALFEVGPEKVGFVGHGTTVATNMMIERRGVTTGLVTTRGFRDVLVVGRQTRPSLYDYTIRKPAPLVPRYLRREVVERLDATGAVLQPLDEASAEHTVEEMLASGVQAIAVCLIHAYRNPVHEMRIRDLIARHAPGVYVSISSEVLPEFREYERTSTTVVNAYIGPRMQGYLRRLRDRIASTGVRVEPLTFHSNGGLLPVNTVEKLPVLTCLSGPAGGVVGSVAIGAQAGFADIITFDVGGTSTDVSLIAEGRPRFTGNRLVAGYPVKIPMLDIHVIGAGGGSIARIDDTGALKVGPESAGAVPGPVAYDRGGTEPTVTDANIVLGRLDPASLLGGRMKVNHERAVAAIEARIARPLGIGGEEAALGILRIATANMSRAIRAVSTQHGHDPGDFVLFAFGGAGPLHGSDVADECGIRRILVPEEPGTLCARGILLSDISRDFVHTQLAPANEEGWAAVTRAMARMVAQAQIWLEEESVPPARRRFQLAIDARYRGQSHDIRVFMDRVDEPDLAVFVEAFHRTHRAEYGHDIRQLPIEVVNCRVQAIGEVTKGMGRTDSGARELSAARRGSRPVYFGAGEGWLESAVYRREQLPLGSCLQGPAIVDEMSATTLVMPWQHVRVDDLGNLLLERR